MNPDRIGAAPLRRGIGLMLALSLLGCATQAAGKGEDPPPNRTTASTQEAVEPSPCLRTAVEGEFIIDEAAWVIQQAVCESAFWFDGLFGEQHERHRQAARGAYGRVELGVGYSQFEGTKVRARFDAKVELTNLQERLSAFIGRDAGDDLVRDRQAVGAQRTQFPRFNDRDETVAGLGYALPDDYFVKTNFRAGVRFSGLNTPRLFAQVRLAVNAYADDKNLVEVRVTPFVNTRDGVGLTLTTDFSHVLSQTYLLRWNSTSTMTQRSAGHSWRSAWILYQRLNLKRGMAYEIFLRGAPEEPEPLTEYGVQVSHRRPVLDERLYLTPAVGYSWPRLDPALERNGSYNLAVFLEMPFGTP